MTQASPGPATDSAQRIAMLIENDLVENGHTTSCIGKLTVRQFEHTEDETEINPVSYTHLTLPTIYSV